MSDWAIWGALIAVVAACAAASVLLFTRARTAWRDAREAGRDVIGRLDRLQASGEEAAEKLAALEGPTEELQQSLDRLRISLARLAVLRSALDEAQVAFGRVAAVVPHR
jgi:predicted nuclease with TOPRIM domain